MDKIEILYEDKDIMAVNKPAGLLVYLPEGARPQQTLLDLIRPYLSFKKQTERSGIVHRLDKETSGVLIIAKNEAAEEKMKEIFQERKIKKEYIATVWGEVIPQKGEISIPLGRGAKDRLKVVPKKLGRESTTLYEVKRYYEKSDQSLIKVDLKTGRTHQIRVHFAAIGHPIVGDEKYSKKKTTLSRHFLHAERVTFYHPVTKEPLSITARLPKELEDYLSDLK